MRELKKMSSRLNAVEKQVASGTASYDSSHNTGRSKKTKISSVVRQSKCKARAESTDSSLSENSNSDGELKLPKLSYIRSSRQIQRQIDQSLAKLGKNPDRGNDPQKLKSKRGGPVEVTVHQKVSWPHEHVLGGQTRQRLTYDQINMSQFVQGFTKTFWMKKIGRFENTCYNILVN